ncbi:MAG: hypothetical protein L3J23_09115 [Flavobacteriaceae bacterium]|nr:hypothetical protein [Flavobacteriaceae bacterium]
MKKIVLLFLVTLNFYTYSQIDYSDTWEDFYSYNNVKDFVKTANKIYAIVDNAVFIYDLNTTTNQKISSVHGLSGETTSALFYDAEFSRIVIGYVNGLVEIINENGSITISDDIERLSISGSKQINHISKEGSNLYLSTPFAIVQYNIENLEFGDTYFIGLASSSVTINQTEIFEDRIYAATENGIYSAAINDPFLIDFNNWQQPQGNLVGNFNTIKKFNANLYTTRSNTLYTIPTPNTLQNSTNFSSAIINLNATNTFLNITTLSSAFIFDINLTQIEVATTTIAFDFELHNSFTEDNTIFLATSTFGILTKPLQTTTYQEIHPDGPLFNDAFSIEVKDNNLWVVYGAYDASYNFTGTRRGFSHFNGENWINTPYINDVEYVDLVDISIDPNHENRVFLSSFKNGMIEVVDDEIITKFNIFNSGLEEWTGGSGLTLVTGSVFDNQSDLWIANAWTNNKIKKYDSSGNWTSFNIEEAVLGSDRGLGEISTDNIGNKWLATRDYGAIVFNENGELKRSLTTQTDRGKLPTNVVKAIIADRNNRIWIGTDKGLVVFSGVGGIFEAETYTANPILIRLEGGTGEEQAETLLGVQSISTIAIDGADNKWFGTKSSGVLGTNPSGRETLNLFNTTNSPLPSNDILKIRVDNTTGKVYFATAKGIVVFNNNVAPFGDTLGETYAYPNPSTSANEFITIDGRNGTHLPRGTNVKIVDSAGYLVHETNVIEGSEIKGGKVIWNKTNLAGRKVASGVYIVLLTLPDKSETSITKIAIIK